MLRYVLVPLLTISLQTSYKDVLTPTLEEVSLSDVFKTVERERLEVVATFYTSTCNGCIGITKTGHDVRNTIYENGKRVIAVDPSIIPLRSLVLVELENGDSFEAIASDTGGDILHHRIDVLVKTTKEAFSLGRQTATVTIIGSVDDEK